MPRYHLATFDGYSLYYLHEPVEPFRQIELHRHGRIVAVLVNQWAEGAAFVDYGLSTGSASVRRGDGTVETYGNLLRIDRCVAMRRLCEVITQRGQQ